MVRERALKIVLIIVGVLFVAAIYPLIMSISSEPALAMMMSLYAALGVFLLVAVRNPRAHRSLIAFTAWSSFAHGTVMAIQAYHHWIASREIAGIVVFFAIGAGLITLAPARQSNVHSSAAAA